MRIKKNRGWAIAALLGAVTAFSACLKSNDNVPPSRPNYYAAIINGAYIPSSMDIFKNSSQKMNSAAYKTGASAPFADIPGTYTFSFRQLNGIGLDSVARQFDSLQYYTMITYNAGTQFRVNWQREDFSTLSNSKVNFRFLNLSPNAGPVDLYIDKKKVVENQPFSLSSPWQQADPYNSNVEYYVTRPGETTALVTGTSRVSQGTTQVPFQPAQAYTIYLAGAKDSTGDNKLQLYYVNHVGTY